MVKRKTDFVELIVWWGEAGNHSRQQQQEEIKINFNYPDTEVHTVLNTVNTTFVWGGKVEDLIRMVAEVSEEETCWVRREAFLHSFPAKVGIEHSRQRKQTASQYLLSLPNTQGNEGKLWRCQTQEVSQTPWSLWSGEETEGQVPECAGLGRRMALGMSFLLSSTETFVDHSCGYIDPQRRSVLLPR